MLNLQDPLNPTPPHETTSNTSSTSSSSSENESPILPSSTYSHLICSSCIVSNPLLTRYAGTEGWMMVVPSLSPSPRDEEQTTTMEWKDKWRVIGRREDISVDGVKHELVEQDKAVGEKRKGLSSPSSPSPSSLYNPAAKRTKIVVDSSSGPPSTTTDSPNTPAAVAAVPVSVCTAPPPNPTAQAIIHALLVTGTNPVSSTTAAASLKTNVEVEAGVGVKGDVFLQEGARESICTCPRVSRVSH
ncbi:hypothetical protein QFC24_003432 [Naganishia onofrii]|uniref:Uncharacterized protein n=1 Tax=Naganishia onofrii TaxID=1851511 RepID=A0ACC2XJW8_9TREE|nr:hypothetical protein QFC24_003432 [Naganishia onofrii]